MGLLDTSLSYVLIVFMFTLLTQAGLNLANNNLTEASTQVGYSTNNNKTNSTLSGFNFAAAGDWGCNEMTQRTVNNMQRKDPEIVLALGDFSYQKIRVAGLILCLPY